MTFYHRRKPWHHKPIRNTLKIPMPTNTARKVRSALLPRVQQLVKGGIVPKPLWLDAALAHPPPVAHKYRWGKPVKFEWRDEDRLRRIWQRRNPEASMHPKVLFLDEAELPPGVQVEHPADRFIKKQQALMRKGLSEEEAYRRVKHDDDEIARFEAEETAAAREAAKSFGAVPAVEASSEGFAASLLRRFAEEAKEAGQPYPAHWFGADGSWVGVGKGERLDRKTAHALNSTADAYGVDDATRALADASLDTVTKEDVEAAAAPADLGKGAGGDADGGAGAAGGEPSSSSEPPRE